MPVLYVELTKSVCFEKMLDMHQGLLFPCKFFLFNLKLFELHSEIYLHPDQWEARLSR